jgi:uncharacterized membrane protein
MKKTAIKVIRITICSVMLALLAGNSWSQISFELLDAPEHGHWADFSLSRDGNNMGCLLGGAVYWWNAADGFRFMDAGSPTQGGVGMSANGKALIATRSTSAGTVPAIWYNDGTFQEIGLPLADCQDDNHSDLGFDLNADGNLAVGQMEYCEVGRAFLWNRNSGPQSLTTTPNLGSRGTAVSADGQVIVGFYDHPREGYRRPALWRNGVGPELFMGHDRSGEALNISLNGQMVVGQAEMGGLGLQAFCWTVGQKPVALGNMGGRTTDSSLASAVSDDGKVVGWMGDELWGSQEAFIWTAQIGMRSLAEILIASGVSLPEDLRLTGALDISGDGTTIVGVSRDKHWKQHYWRLQLEDSSQLDKVVKAGKWPAPPTEPATSDSIEVFRANFLNPFPYGKNPY